MQRHLISTPTEIFKRVDRISNEIDEILASWETRNRYRVSFWEFLHLPISEIITNWI
jgi:hypothetical protein